jgi:hypothetical protein
MKRQVFPVCLLFLLLLAGAGIPATAASPVLTGVSPTYGTLGGVVTLTITGSGFESGNRVALTKCGLEDNSDQFGLFWGSVLSLTPTQITATFELSGPLMGVGDYDIKVLTDHEIAKKSAVFRVYPGAGITYTSIAPRTVTTTYQPAGPYGTIYVESSPSGAVIYLDDENKGHAPVTITGLWPGTYTVSAELSGYQKYTTTTTLSGPTRSSVYCHLVPDREGTGLYIVSTPSPAKVYLDGDLRGETPLVLSTPGTGTHSVRISLSGYDDWKSTVEIQEGGTRTISAILIQKDTAFTRGINVSSNPVGAKVLLDGLVKGTTPVTLKDMAAGIHILEVEYPGYNSWKSTIDVPEAEMKEIPINLTPKAASMPGWITVSSVPENASVTLDGNYVGRTPANSSLNLDSVTPGEHAVALVLPGYKPYFTNVTVSPNKVSMVNTTLAPVLGPLAKGALSVTSDPPGAAISVDNRSIGISPLNAQDIAGGDHLIRIQMEGYQDYSTNVFVTAGKTSTVSAMLLPVTPALHSPVLPLAVIGALAVTCFLSRRKKE